MENDALIEFEKKKVKLAVVFQASDPVPPPSTSKEPASDNSSVTPAYEPHPRRIQKRPAALRSPYIDFATKRTSIAARMFVIYMLLCVHMEMQGLLYLKKLKSVYAHNHVFLHYFKNVDHHVINDLCSLSCFFYVCSVVIISFWSFYVTLDHLALSVKPGGKLMSLVVEIAIYTIDDTSRKTVKRVLPLRVSVSSYFSSIILLL